MSGSRIKLFVVGTVIAAAVGILAYAGMQKGRVYYVGVDGFLANSALRDGRARIYGTVAEEGLVIKAGERTASFVLRGDYKNLPVVFNGSIPDMFKGGVDVVVEGRLGPNGVFQADQLLTKCASKYKPAAPASRPEASP